MNIFCFIECKLLSKKISAAHHRIPTVTIIFKVKCFIWLFLCVCSQNVPMQINGKTSCDWIMSQYIVIPAPNLFTTTLVENSMKAKGVTQLCASCATRLNLNTWDHKETRVFGELWDSTVPHAALSVKAVLTHLGDHLECQCHVMHLLPLSSDWRLLFDRVGYPRREPTKSFYHLARVTACDHCSCQ